MNFEDSEQLRRRDPRIEQIQRNRLHPLHESLSSASTIVRGPSGLLRKNPHHIGFMGPNGIKRIDRLAGNGPAIGRGQGAKKVTSEAPRPLLSVEQPEQFVLAVMDMVGGRLTAHDKDVLGQAQQLATELPAQCAVVAVVFGAIKEKAFELAGVDRLIHLSGEAYEGYCPEQSVAALQAIDAKLHPRFWLFPDSVHGAGELGLRLAAQLKERPATQAWQVTLDKTVFRGGSGRSDICADTPRLLLLAEECAPPVEETRHEAKPVSELREDSVPRALCRINDGGQVAVDPKQISLDEAEFILAAGNGIQDWAQFHQAAELLRATEGASRVAVDDGFMPRNTQVGATGTWVSARAYIAVGISGAVQHLQGIATCDKVIAINTDAGCDMVKRADLSVIGDSQEILAELISLCEQRQEKGVEHVA